MLNGEHFPFLGEVTRLFYILRNNGDKKNTELFGDVLFHHSFDYGSVKTKANLWKKTMPIPKKKDIEYVGQLTGVRERELIRWGGGGPFMFQDKV